MRECYKLGFTLIELIVAIAIIAVIAAVTIPSIATGAQNRKLAASLGRSVETVESGCRMLIQDMSEKSTDGEFIGHFSINKALDGSDINNAPEDSVSANDGLFANAPEYFNVMQLSADKKADYESRVRSFAMTTPSPALSEIAGKYSMNTKLGAYFGVKSNKVATTTISDPIVEYVYIDVNGEASPNRYGLDIFLFGLSDRCYMIPAGSSVFKKYKSSIDLATNSCDGNSVTNGLSCTSRVIKDGYKINYRKQ